MFGGADVVCASAHNPVHAALQACNISLIKMHVVAFAQQHSHRMWSASSAVTWSGSRGRWVCAKIAAVPLGNGATLGARKPQRLCPAQSKRHLCAENSICRSSEILSRLPERCLFSDARSSARNLKGSSDLRKALPASQLVSHSQFCSNHSAAMFARTVLFLALILVCCLQLAFR